MIAIAFVIPCLIFSFYNSTNTILSDWNTNKEVTIFLSDEVNLAQAESLRTQLAKQATLAQVTLVTREQALTDFKQKTDLGPVIENLSSNPLPHILIASLEENVTGLASMQEVKQQLAQMKQVEHVELDILWIEKIQAALDTFLKILWITCIILAAAIALIISNVIRWEVSSRNEELEIIRLLGGTDAYVRRPFLYSGFWLGLTGAVIATIFTVLCILLLSTNMAVLSDLFGNEYKLTMLNYKHVIFLVCLGGFFGVFGAWVASMQRLRLHS